MISRVRAIVARDLAIEFSYQLRLVVRVLSLTATLVFIYYVSEFVGAPEGLADYGSTYFDYVIVGIALTSYAGLGIGDFVSRIGQEQAMGTFEILLAGPTSLWLLLLSGFIVPFAFTTIELGLIVGIGLGVVGSGFSLGSILISLPLIIVTTLSFCAFGIAAAALIVLAKRGDILTGPLYQATVAFSGVLFPVSLFPDFVEPVAYLFPSFYGLRGIRDALLGDAGFIDVADDLAIVTGFCLVLLPASLWLFDQAITKAKRSGILSNY